MKLLGVGIIFMLFRVGSQDIITKVLDRIIATEKIENIAILTISDDPFENLPISFLTSIPYVIFKKGDAAKFNRDARKVLKGNLLFIVCCNIKQTTILEAGVVLQTFHSSKGLFMDHSNSTNTTGFFQWCWQNGFMDVLLSSRSYENNIFRYEQFPNFRIFKINDNIKYEWFNAKAQLKNINGYPIRTPITREPPRVMQYFDYKRNKTVFGGYSYNILNNFLKNVNGTLTQLNYIKEYDMGDFRKHFITDEIDICVHPYMAGENYSISFPIKTLGWRIMVPVEGKFDPYLYFILPFADEVWIAISLTLFYISVISSVMQYVALRKFKWMECFCEVLLRFLNMPSEIPLYNGIINILTLKFQVLWFAFIINNLYLAHLTTFLATELPVRNIDTLEELIQKNIKILAFQYETERLLKIADHRNFEKILGGITPAEMILRRNKLSNTSFAYTSVDDRTFFFFKQQERLKRPIFHLMKDCLSIIQLGLPMPLDSPFLSPFNDYLMKILQSGLISKWENDGVDTGRLSGELEILHEDDYEIYKPLSLSDLQFAWMSLMIGNSLSILVFSGSWLLHIVRGG